MRSWREGGRRVLLTDFGEEVDGFETLLFGVIIERKIDAIRGLVGSRVGGRENGRCLAGFAGVEVRLGLGV